MTFFLFSRSHRHFETQILIEKSLSAHYNLNQWLEFDQTSTDASLGHGKEVVRFWWPWPHFQGHYFIKTLKMSLMCTLSHESIDGIWPNYHRYFIGIGERSDQILVTLTSLSRSHWHFETQILMKKSLGAHHTCDIFLGSNREICSFW